MQKISIKTLGCKLNQYDSSLIINQFQQNGWQVKSFGEKTDLVIINTCTVTNRSDQKCRNYIRQGARFSKKNQVIVTGCLVDRDAESIINMPEVMAVFGNSEKNLLYKDIMALPEYSELEKDAIENFNEKSVTTFKHTRAYLKIQDGCDGNCSYCIVPRVRGLPQSRPLKDILEHARQLIDFDTPEIVLTGITIGKYNDSGHDLADLVAEIVKIPGKFRVRITSIEPLHVTDALIDLLKHEKVCRHIHLPLQSGSDKILKLMNRPYNREQYLHIVNKIKNQVPEIAIGADIIIGYPEESERDFQQSLNLVKEAAFAYVHQFSFSIRTGTKAAKNEKMCLREIVVERSGKMRDTVKISSKQYRAGFIGQSLPSVIEKGKKIAEYFALSDNYIKMQIDDQSKSAVIAGKILPIVLYEQDNKIMGKLE